MRISEETLSDACDEWSETIHRENWRHGTKDHIVFKLNDQFYKAIVPVHHEEGWQLCHDVEVIPVHQVEKTVKVWEPVK